MELIAVVLFCFLITAGFDSTISIELKSYISGHGLHGTITFTYVRAKDLIKITTNLNTTLEYPTQVWSWCVNEFPVDYTIIENRCDESKLGKKIINLDDIYGYLILPENKTSEYKTHELTVTGSKGLYGKSILLRNVDTNQHICASISITDKTTEKVAVAKFNSPISGQVHFRWFTTKDNDREMVITADLYHVTKVENLNETKDFAEHKWKIYVTDILETHKSRSDDNCNILQIVFDPENKGNGKAVGDVDARLGNIKVSTNYNRNKYKTLFRDEDLILLPSDITGPQRRLYVVVFESKHPTSFLACSKIRYDHPVNAKIIMQSGGIKGDIKITQSSRFEPTFLNFNLTTARGDIETKLVYSSSVAGYKIHELPISAAKTVEQSENACLSTAIMYNPLKINSNYIPPNGFGTQDQYAVGDLSGKLLGRNNVTGLVPGSQELSGNYWDIYLPMQGKHSIIHRSLVIYKTTQYSSSEVVAEPWICGNIVVYDNNFKYQKQIFTAQVLFRYPIVGRILFRQPKDEPWADTTIFVDYLVHADGSNLNNSAGHRWAIHNTPPGKDFYSWKDRCLSAGNIYNPYKVDFNDITPAHICNIEGIGMCRLGDLSSRHGTLEISGKKKDSNKISRRFINDPLMPLTGPSGVLGKSFVIYDDHGPKARGERMACSIIGGIYRRKAVARNWFPNGDPLSVKGKLEFYQQTEFDITNIEVDLEGLIDTSEYHIHITPVEENLEFPCEATSLYGNWNPLNVDPTSSPRIYHGTPDQYEMGDLSGKFGTLDNHTIYKDNFNDTMLPLYGPRSIIGRSIVLHKREDNRRWACSTIERGYSSSEARELRAIASFHHPGGFAYGYMRMTQLVYNDGSTSDTIIEIKLRHPGKFDRNVTRDHEWSVYVNPIGVDAAVKIQNTRCVAGGYIWNPYYTQLADPLNEDLYRQECGPLNPLRCYVGDLSARLGTIDIGLERKVVVDQNLPLEGPVSAIGRSIVIKSPNKQPEAFACANIEPDYNIIKYANIEKPPRFVLAQFIDDVREVMGIPEWMLTVDTRKIKNLHNNACIQFLMYFKGPIAGKLEQDFSRLISIGQLDSPSLYIPGYINTKRKYKLSYKQCGMRDANEKNHWRSTSGTSKKCISLLIFKLSTFILMVYN